jgi:hypothetical protein
MRYTDRIFPERIVLVNTANVVSVKIVSSDYGYPLHVYGTIIARDSLDNKCIYMFRRGKDDCQLISSKVLLCQKRTQRYYCYHLPYAVSYRIIVLASVISHIILASVISHIINLIATAGIVLASVISHIVNLIATAGLFL